MVDALKNVAHAGTALAIPGGIGIIDVSAAIGPGGQKVSAHIEMAAHLFEIARRVGVAQQAAFDCERVGMIIAGYEVPHTHIHVVPTNAMSELSFANAAASVDRDDLEAWADAIRERM